MSMRAAGLPRSCSSAANTMPPIDVYQGGLKGIFEHDPTLLLGLAQAQFAASRISPPRARRSNA